jgi:hypothetical protein
MPDLAPDQAVFRVSLPSAWPLATDYLLIVLFCLGGCVLGAVIAVLFGGIAGKDSFSGWGLVSAGFLAFGAGLLLLFGALAVYYLVRMSRLAMFSLTAHGDGALTAGLPHRSVHLVLAGLRARRILAPDSSDLYALVIVPKHGPEVWIPTFPENPHQRRFLEQLCAWLEARGVPVSTQRRLISSSQLLFLWEITVWAALAIVCVFGAPAIVAPVSFWVQWLLWGTASFLIVLGFYFAALALGIVFWLGSMGKWMRELFTGALFRMPLRSDERFPTLIMEESLSAETFGMDSRRGSLRVEGNALVVETRKDRWRIEPSRVVEIQRAGLDATVVMMSQERFLLRPIKILWEGEDGCLRGLYVASRGGWTVRRNLRLDRQLFQMLETWRRDGGVPALAQLSLGPRRLGAALAAVFLILTIFLIPIHNKLVGDYLRTGKLLMPSWVKPGARLGPVSVLSAQAIEPGPVLCADRFRDMLCIPRCWTKDFATGQIRPFASLSFPIPSFPDGGPHVLQVDHRFPWELMLLPPGKRGKAPDWPARLYSLETGRGRDIRSFPQEGRWNTSAALYKNERIFYTYRKDYQGKSPVEMGWIDARKDECHPLGQLAGPETQNATFPAGASVLPLAFFPGGHRVLCGWNLVDLESGECRLVSRPAGIEPRGFSLYGADVFPAGDRLRLRVRPPSRVTSSTLESAPPYLRLISSAVQTSRTTTLVCEIDPVTAQAEVIDTLPTSVTLLSADGNRWLVSEQVAGAGSPALGSAGSAPGVLESAESQKRRILKLYNHDTRTSETLFEALPGAFYRLVAGRPELLVWSVGGDLSVEPIRRQTK